MERRPLGGTGLSVSRLCFGSLTMGPLQRNLAPEAGGRLIAAAFERGVNFIDTADLYDTYAHIKHAMDLVGRDALIVSSKSYAYDGKTAEKTLGRALKELDRDYIDLFMLHEQESIHTIRGHWEAVEFFMKQKDAGHIRALGLSTHHVAGVLGANAHDVFQVVHPIFNMTGIGIQDGTITDMIQAVKEAKALGKGIFAMKPLGGGTLISRREEAFKFVLNMEGLDSVAVGMQSLAEVEDNANRFEGRSSEAELVEKIDAQNRRLHIAGWCRRCGKCVEACSQGALSLGTEKVVVDADKCVLCGYCAAACPDFCIKVI